MVQKAGYKHVQDAYARYTDVVFEWHQVLDPWQRNAVKALVGINSLIDENHPLHIKGTEGATLFLGVDATGSRRLLFSLKQLQYIQYYIHEIGLVKEKPSENDNSWVPLPGAAHLMAASVFVQVESINLPTAVALRNQIRHLSKFNKALHNPKAHPRPAELEPRKTIEDVAAEAGTAPVTAETVEQPGPEQVAQSQQVKAEPSMDHGNAVFFHAQQALTIASTGGTPAMIKDSADGPAYQSAIGRGLFLALDITIWEFDDDIVLEFGYAAAWFEKKINLDQDGIPIVKPGKEDNESEMVLRKDRGHWTVQEHLNVHRNGLVKPDNRGHYLFGDSLPIQAKHFNGAVLGMINDLRRRAGDGSSAVVYAIIHSPDSPLAELFKVGLDISTWSPAVVSPPSKKPAYADPQALSSVVFFDTAELFAAVEFDPAENEGIDVPRTTDKSLGEVGMIMFGSDEAKAPTRLGNAGNDAFYNLEAFLAMASGPPLDVLRVDYRLSQSIKPGAPGSPAPSVRGIVPGDSDAKVLASDNLSPISTRPSTAEQAAVDDSGELPDDYMAQANTIAADFASTFVPDEEGSSFGSPPESESDDEMDIKGVFFGDVELDDPEELYA